MPEIQFASTAPGIATFNANMAQGNMERRQAEEDAIRRVQFEQAQGADAAQRAAAAGYFQNPANAAPMQAAPVVVPSTPVQIPNPAATTPIVSPDPSAGLGPNNIYSDYGGPSRSAPAPNRPPRAGVDVPATISAPSAIAAFSAQPPVARAQPTYPTGTERYGQMARTLAQAPGTGAALMNMVGTDVTSQRAAAVQQQKLQMEGHKEVLGYLRDGDVDLARQASKAYGINIPDEIWKNKSAVMELRIGANTAKTAGIKDEHAVHFLQGYMEGIASGMQPGEAAKSALQKMPKNSFDVKHTVIGQDNTLYGIGPHGETKDLGIKARPQKWQVTGEKDTATVQNRNDMVRRIKSAYPGVDDQFANQLIVNPHSQPSTDMVLRTMSNLRKLTKNFQPVYKSEAEVKAAAMQTIKDAQAGAKSLTAQPVAADSGASPAAAAGKRVKFDAMGNEITAE